MSWLNTFVGIRDFLTCDVGCRENQFLIFIYRCWTSLFGKDFNLRTKSRKDACEITEVCFAYPAAAAAAAKSLQSCLTLCDPIDGSPPCSPVPGILQARTLEWVAIAFSSAWKWKVKVKLLSHVRLFPTLWTAAYQAPPPMGFSRQAYWSGLPLPSPSLTLASYKAVKHLFTALGYHTRSLSNISSFCCFYFPLNNQWTMEKNTLIYSITK